ncbi:MAG: calcineurin-like phosphoesterase family protein [Chthonomonadaceae bacterium]|nr:calcineurin-like phosphoesterase family protein [Chthonomonadaceae bacterium]
MNRREFLQRTGTVMSLIAASQLSRASTVFIDRFQVDKRGVRYAEGVVFHDRNRSGKREAGDPGVSGVCVSNGRDVVKTDAQGRWRLPVTEDTILFVIKPSGWQVPLDEYNLPNYYYVHKPTGSPDSKYRGVEPTGSLPDSIDFPLLPQREDAKFRMVLFGDPQPRNQTEVDYIAHDVVEQAALDAAAQGAKFGMSLGDEMFDVLSLYESLNQTVGTIGLPWYNTVGNHDLNYDAPDNSTSTETFQRVFGPPHYAFNFAKVHFIVLNNVVWNGSKTGGYKGEITAQQLEFVKRDLEHVPLDRLVVIAMHIPIVDVENREDLYRLIEARPHTLSLSAHTHVQEHHFLSSEDGWRGEEPHHHLNHATVCGSWWEGAPDERGIPHATMSDGAPNGYSIVEFDGAKYKVAFRPANRPLNDQMNIWIPEQVSCSETANTEVVVNVFAGSIRSIVDIRVGGGEWERMTNFEGYDPFFARLKEIEAGPNPPPGLKLPKPSLTQHLWKAKLPSNLQVGTHVVDIRTTDMFGQSYSDRRLVRVI